ncbi:MAG: OsmC family protein [Candidatus Odinarchaeota archaeon]
MSKKEESHSYTIFVERVHDFEFRVQFDRIEFPEWTLDEPSPLGQDKGPNATRVLAAAIGNCLSASLLFCLQRSKLMVDSLRTEVTPTSARNEEGRWRVHHVDVKILIKTAENDSKRFQRCVEIFEKYCIVTASVRQGIPVNVNVLQSE